MVNDQEYEFKITSDTHIEDSYVFELMIAGMVSDDKKKRKIEGLASLIRVVDTDTNEQIVFKLKSYGR